MPEPNVWRVARDLADRGQPDSALALLRTAIEKDSADLDLRWLEAGITGESGRHAEAVARYERLAGDFPARAEDLRSDLAAERLWSGDKLGAVRDFRSWLATHPDDRTARKRLALALAQSDSLRQALALYGDLHREDATDTDVALERARVLGWMGRHREAITAYQAILEREPGNTDAKLGVATNENWSGQHRRATRNLESMLGDPGADMETGKTLAFARYWDDDPDGALLALDRYRRQAPGDSEAVDLAQRIAREGRSTVELGSGRADDSDDFHVASPALEIRWPLAPRLMGHAGWRTDLAHDAVVSTGVMRLSAGARYRFGPAWTTYATGAHYSFDGGFGQPWGGELGVINRPVDHVRFEVVTVREPIVTRLSIENGISLLQWVGAGDWTALPRLTLHADARAGFYSDGNRNEHTSAFARVQTYSSRRTDLALQLGVEQLKAHQDLDHGYYDPAFHREWGPSALLEWRPAPHWALGGALQTGWQLDKGSEATAFYGVSGRVALVPDADWTLSLEGWHGDSDLQTAGGYRRTWWQLSVLRGF
jgi:tetratricopeptide (TPR) repeat protein